MKCLSIDESYVFASSKKTSTASSLGGEVVRGGGSRPLQLLNAFLEEDSVNGNITSIPAHVPSSNSRNVEEC